MLGEIMATKARFSHYPGSHLLLHRLPPLIHLTQRLLRSQQRPEQRHLLLTSRGLQKGSTPPILVRSLRVLSNPDLAHSGILLSVAHGDQEPQATISQYLAFLLSTTRIMWTLKVMSFLWSQLFKMNQMRLHNR